MKELRIPYIIHLFALVHAAVVLLCYAFNVRDELLLTAATVTLFVIICIRKQQGVSIIAASVIAGNILGFVIGTYGAQLMRHLLTNDALLHAVTSLFTTEILGFGLFLLLGFFNAHNDQSQTATTRWHPSIGQVLLVIGGILLLRIFYTRIFTGYFSEEIINFFFRNLLGNSLAVVTLLCCNIIYIRITRRFSGFNRPLGYIVGLLCESLALAALTACIIGYELPFGTATPFAEATFVQLFAISFLANIAIYVVVVLLGYVWKTHNRLHDERDKRHLAQFRYNILKQQVNPHFLFNSLNILNGLVEEQKNAEASQFIRKLASLYRYMLQNEHESVVRLRDELDFTEQYIDLLKVRFPNGFAVETHIEPQNRERYVVPCSVQLLIENALKHNIVRADNPLMISIRAANGTLTVCNKLHPKCSEAESTHLGLKNIARQYLDITGKEIKIHQTTEEFQVELPLI